MRLLHNMLALVPCGKSETAGSAIMMALPESLSERVHFTNFAYCGGLAACTHARWFAR